MTLEGVCAVKDKQKLIFEESFKAGYDQNVKDMIEMKKDLVYMIQTAQDRYVVKFFQDESVLNWQEKCLVQLANKQTKGIVPFIPNTYGTCVNVAGGKWYTVMPFIPGKTINQQNEKDVINSFKLLSYFHKQGYGIYGKSQVIPFRSKIMEKWRNRLHVFTETMEQLKQYGPQHMGGIAQHIQGMAPEAIQWAHYSLNHLSEVYLVYLEEQAQWGRQVAHLDVASHNFLVIEPLSYYLIDYNLINYAPPVLDVVQFLYDVLPYYGWSFEFAMYAVQQYEEYTLHQKIERKFLCLLLIYPYDLFREWIGVWKRKEGFHPEQIYHHFQQMSERWHNRQKFVKDCMAMLK